MGTRYEVQTSTHNLYFEQKYEKYQIFFENFQFLEVKCSLYLNRCVFLMNEEIMSSLMY